MSLSKNGDIYIDTFKYRDNDKRKQVELAYTPHQLTIEQLQRLNRLDNIALTLGYLILEITPPGRLQSLALTQLEVTVGHAREAIRQENT